MADMMEFPNTVEEFMEQYKIVDTEQVYTNGAELVPIFRMKQWFDHIEEVNKTNDDTISRQAAIDALGDEPEVWSEKDEYEQGLNNQWHYDVNALKAVPSAERHGHWIENETSYADHPTKQTCNCSICGKASTRPLGDWCRWCGAKMEEVERNEN